MWWYRQLLLKLIFQDIFVLLTSNVASVSTTFLTSFDFKFQYELETRSPGTIQAFAFSVVSVYDEQAQPRFRRKRRS